MLDASALRDLLQRLGTTDQLLDLLYDGVDRSAIGFAFEQCQGNQTQMARLLGISRTTLKKKINKLGLQFHSQTPNDSQPE